MNYRFINICLILCAFSAVSIALLFAYKNFYYDPKNEWKLISDKKNHVYVVKNRGEEICYFDVKKSDMITGTAARVITGKWVKTNCK